MKIKEKTKKIISVLLTAVLAAVLFAGCGKRQDAPVQTEGSSDKFQIVTTVFPVYDWVREIVGQEDSHTDTEVTLLLKNGVDLHSYQPSAEDLTAMANADVFIYIGGHSDDWVADALKNEGNPNRVVINLFDVLNDSLKPLARSEGMEHYHDHDEDMEDHDDHDDHDEDRDEYDEHIWLSLPRAKTAVLAMADAMAKANPALADTYRSNAKEYAAKLLSLHQNYGDAVKAATVNTLVFADRFPFFYMADDYGLQYYAAFTGCSAECEASFETVAVLAHKMDELGIQNVMTIENRTHGIPETVIENTKDKNQHILTMNSLQSVTEKQIMDGMTYLDVMESNLDVLKTALQ